MGDQTTLSLTRDSQQDAYEQAREAVLEDHDDDVIDADEWGSSLPDGEVVRILAEAYTGELDIAGHEVSDTPPTVSVPASQVSGTPKQ